MTQSEMFPKTELDEATAVLDHLKAERDKAAKAVVTANDKLDDAMERVCKQRHVVNLLQSQMPATDPAVDGEATEEDVEDAEVLEIDGEVVDPVTGEVTSTKESLPTPDTMTVPELAAEWGAIVEQAGDVDEVPDEARERFDAIDIELRERGRNPADWRELVNEKLGPPPDFTTFAEASQPPEDDDDIWTSDEEGDEAA